jgi:hypothetical protein
MAIISIKDLTESVELDRRAMAAISGGARSGGRQPLLAQRTVGSTRIVEYPAGISRKPLTAGSILFK